MELALLRVARLLMQIAHGIVETTLAQVIADRFALPTTEIKLGANLKLISRIAQATMSFQKIGKYGVEHEAESHLHAKHFE